MNEILKQTNELKKVISCPKCDKIFKTINGLLVSCDCGYVDDSTFSQINYQETAKTLLEKAEKGCEIEKVFINKFNVEIKIICDEKDLCPDCQEAIKKLRGILE